MQLKSGDKLGPFDMARPALRIVVTKKPEGVEEARNRQPLVFAEESSVLVTE
jgi:hypothetical protein